MSTKPSLISSFFSYFLFSSFFLLLLKKGKSERERERKRWWNRIRRCEIYHVFPMFFWCCCSFSFLFNYQSIVFINFLSSLVELEISYFSLLGAQAHCFIWQLSYSRSLSSPPLEGSLCFNGVFNGDYGNNTLGAKNTLSPSMLTGAESVESFQLFNI